MIYIYRVTCSTLVVYPRATNIEQTERTLSDNVSSAGGDIELEEVVEHSGDSSKDHPLEQQRHDYFRGKNLISKLSSSMSLEKLKDELPLAGPVPIPSTVDAYMKVCQTSLSILY